jgi:hypothetical protein
MQSVWRIWRSELHHNMPEWVIVVCWAMLVRGRTWRLLLQRTEDCSVAFGVDSKALRGGTRLVVGSSLQVRMDRRSGATTDSTLGSSPHALLQWGSSAYVTLEVKVLGLIFSGSGVG